MFLFTQLCHFERTLCTLSKKVRTPSPASPASPWAVIPTRRLKKAAPARLKEDLVNILLKKKTLF